MKLIEKKCPNCGAGLKFDKDDTEVVCEYCKKSYVIQRDNTEKKDSTDLSDIDYELIEEVFDKFNEVTKEMFRGPRVASKVITVIVIIVFISIFFGAFTLIGSIVSGDFGNEFKSRFEEKVEEKIEIKYVTELEQLDEQTKEIMKTESKKDLAARVNHLSSDYTLGEWEFEGYYLLTNENGNELYNVYSNTVSGNANMKIYGVVMFSDLEIGEDNIVSVNLQNSRYFAPILNLNDRWYSYVSGYDSLESFYNNVLRNKRNDYTIKYSEGMYIEN